jgi:acyl-CoA synthetase (AMP-forming)/AMP-acid ligase II
MGGCDAVKSVIVYRRTGGKIDRAGPRMHELADAESDHCPPEWVGAEHPLFILYTSGSTGKPKGVQHSTGGYLLWAAQTMKWTFDSSPTTCSGARPTSAGSPATPTSPTARWPAAARRSCSKACRPTRTPAASGR